MNKKLPGHPLFDGIRNVVKVGQVSNMSNMTSSAEQSVFEDNITSYQNGACQTTFCSVNLKPSAKILIGETSYHPNPVESLSNFFTH